ncbi:SDR family oxidoreductase [Shimazuella kribbensis]|uniref:SDR family oxidoreductase n=1 Tax=Shimazuella kribbensis TaxID=139808 RepID=UPI00041E708E|nr:SDR family oxidoreductase [Shimazuella kribbensis]
MEKPVALITGASSGFGLLMSISLAKRGYHVVATMRNPEKSPALETYNQLENIEVVKIDVTKHDEMTTSMKQIISRLGKIDVLINNAGYAEAGFVEDISIDAYRHQFDTNVFGLIAMTKAVLPFMRERKQGKIINISSISGRFGFPALSPYTASKHAIEGFSESLRLEMLPYGVYVSLVEPGSYKTAIWSKGMTTQSKQTTSAYEVYLTNILQEIDQTSKNAGNPREVADLIVQIATSKRPKLRYPIGKNVKMQLLLKSLLPWEWLEQRVIKLASRTTKSKS